MPGRSFSANGYRFGFNGKEKDDETYGQGNVYNYGFRIYNPRLGRFLSVDPLAPKYPWYTPYQFAGNKPIVAIDIDGLEDYIIHLFVDDEGNITKIRVIRFENVAGDVQNTEMYKNSSKKVENKKVIVFTYDKDGNMVGNPTYQDALTKTQEEIRDKRLTKVENLSVTKAKEISTKEYKSKKFTSGKFVVSEQNFQYKLNLEFYPSSDELKPEEKSKIEQLGKDLQDFSELNVTLTGNAGLDLGSTLPTGGGDRVLKDAAILNKKSSTTGELMKARAEAVKSILIKDYKIDPSRITTKPGIRYGDPSGRRVDGQLDFKKK